MGPYDSSLQMFVQAPRELDGKKLEDVRWRVENGLLGQRPVLGRPTGREARALGYESSEGEAIKVNVFSKPTPEGAKIKLEGVRRGERE